jgi:hypothetical protein
MARCEETEDKLTERTYRLASRLMKDRGVEPGLCPRTGNCGLECSPDCRVVQIKVRCISDAIAKRDSATEESIDAARWHGLEWNSRSEQAYLEHISTRS